MVRPSEARISLAPAVLRLCRLAPLGDREFAALLSATGASPTIGRHRELLVKGQEIAEPLLIMDGWAARMRYLADGRRQFLSFLLAGDLIGMCRQAVPLAASTVMALISLTYCAPPSATDLPALEDAYAISQAVEEAHLLAHITRL